MFLEGTWIKADDIKKNHNEIIVSFSISDDLVPYFNDCRIHSTSYDFNVENVPDSIAIIPFVSNMFSLAFFKNAKIIIDTLEKTFYECLGRYLSEYSYLFKLESRFSIVSRLISTIPLNETNDNACLLFSGGVDAVNSLVCNQNKITDCYFIQGADFTTTNDVGFNFCFNNNKKIISLFNKKLYAIKTNFKEYYNENLLDKEVFYLDESGWWHGFQHGIAFLGSLAPAIYERKYRTVLIASSFTKEFDPICASNHRFDSCFSVCGCKTVHDGYEFDRCQKIENIFEWIKKNNSPLPIHVCWKTQSGFNCGECEKCLRTYLGCLCTNNDPNQIGLNTKLSFKKIKRYYFLQSGELDTIFNRNTVLNLAIERHFEKVPNNLKWIRKCFDNKYFLKKRKYELMEKRIKKMLKSFIKK